jgi:hypothetical protein
LRIAFASETPERQDESQTSGLGSEVVTDRPKSSADAYARRVVAEVTASVPPAMVIPKLKETVAAWTDLNVDPRLSILKTTNPEERTRILNEA